MGLLHVAHEDCEKGMLALSILRCLGANVCVLTGSAPPILTGNDVIAYFGSPGRFPSKHLRILRPADLESRGFVRASWALPVPIEQCVALRVSVADAHSAGLVEAVTNVLHHFAGTRPARKPSEKHLARRGRRFVGRTPGWFCEG